MDRSRDDATDGALVSAARGGDERAFETLLRRHESRVLRVLRLLGVTPEDRDDVVQEVFVRVFRHLDRFQTGRPFGAWVYRIAVNAAHDQRLRRQRIAARETGLDTDTVAEPIAPGADAEAAVAGQQRWQQLEQSLSSLTERERAVFVLCELEGLETREVARSLGITRITVRRHPTTG